MQLPKCFTWPNGAKVLTWAWWFVLLVFFSLLAWTRAEAFTTGQATAPDVVLLVVWLALALAPIFHEVNVFGLKLKRQIQALEKDVAGQFATLRAEITTSSRATAFQETHYHGLTPASQVTELGKELRELKAELGDRGARRAAPEQEPQEPLVISPDQIEAPKEVTFLFAVRFNIEKELRRIWALKMPETSPSHPTWSEMLNGLVDDQVLARRAAYQISNVIRITAWGIHGETLTESHLMYVRDAAPFLISLLRHTD